MTTTHKISPAQWRGFFDTLNALYLGWELAIEVLGPDVGDQTLGEGLQLQGFSFDSRKPDADLMIEAGNVPDVSLVHCVHRPTAVWIAETQLGAEADIQVESEDETVTLVRLRRLPALPEASAAGKRRPVVRRRTQGK